MLLVGAEIRLRRGVRRIFDWKGHNPALGQGRQIRNAEPHTPPLGFFGY